MPGYIGDISTYYGNQATTSMTKSSASSAYTNSSMDAYGLDMSDFLTLMVAQFTNQTMDNAADTSEMLNQMVQMQMVTALQNMTDASVMTYAASLVGKEVTVAGTDGNGDYYEKVGNVTGTGTYSGKQVVFVDGEMYYMNEIMAVGRLPEKETVSGTENNNSQNGQENGTETTEKN
ncbi:MAG: hypothetical protein IJ955_08830 [Oscillospiraceae bacterium]|nr:hypothetical protein [Oscillospiraceae bacterium]